MGVTETVERSFTEGAGILLVAPHWNDGVVEELYCRKESLSLAYLAAYLRQENIAVDVLDSMVLCIPHSRTIDICRRKPYRIIGISCISQRAFSSALELIERIRAGNTTAHIVIGGIFASLAHREILERFPIIDSVIRGDGERPLRKLCEAISTGKRLETVPNLSFRDRQNTVQVNPDQPQIMDLDVYPFPERDYLPYVVDEVSNGTREIGMLAFRGCEAKCSFCSIPPLVREAGRRMRSPGNVVDEMIALNANWGIDRFRFYDDTFIGKGRMYPHWYEEFSDLVIDNLPGIRIEAMGITANGVQEDVFNRLHRAGLRKVFLGLDAGTKMRLRKYKKPATVQTNLQAVDILKKYDIEARYGFIMFHPNMKFEELKENFEFLKQVGNYRSHNLNNRFNLFIGTLKDEHNLPKNLIKNRAEFSSRKHYVFRDENIRRFLRDYEPFDALISTNTKLAASIEFLEIEVRNSAVEKGAIACADKVKERRLALLECERQLTTDVFEVLIYGIEEGEPKTQVFDRLKPLLSAFGEKMHRFSEQVISMARRLELDRDAVERLNSVESYFSETKENLSAAEEQLFKQEMQRAS